jgi:hypothetical protein
MTQRISAWLRLLATGGLMLGSVGTGCLSDALRDVSDEIDEFADDIDQDTGSDFDDLIDDLEDLFD